MSRLSALILVCALSPAFGQDQTGPNLAATGSGRPGGVARIVLAHQLFALGIANNDPISTLNAARLAASVTLMDMPRAAETVGDAPPLVIPSPTTTEEMFDAAAALASEDEALLDLIDASRTEAAFAPRSTAISTPAALASGETARWSLPFYGASLAEIAVLGSGAGNIDLSVLDENGTPVCQEAGPADVSYCSFYPLRNATFVVVVTNLGVASNTYLLLTN